MLSGIFSIYLISSVLAYFVDYPLLKQLKDFNNNLIDKILEKVDEKIK